MIEWPDAGHERVVRTVRLGQGGFIVTVAPVGDGAGDDEQQITLTATEAVRKCGHMPTW